MTDAKTINDELMIFREHYSGINVNVEDGYMTYKTAAGYGKRAAARANLLIQTLGLSLTAEATTLHTDDSFIIKPN